MPNAEIIPDDIRETARHLVELQSAWLRDEPLETCRELIVRSLMAERERCAQYADAWSRPDALRLAAGEMTAQEMRTATAVARGIAAAIRQP